MKVTKEVDEGFQPVTLEIVFETEEELEVFDILMSYNVSVSNNLFKATLQQHLLEQVMGAISDELQA